MRIRLTAQCAEKALHSTSAVYHVAKATAKHGDLKVIDKMAKIEQASGVPRHQAIIQATIRHEEIMHLSESGPKYKEMADDLDKSSASAKAQTDSHPFANPSIAGA